jgi:methylated-DNA-protein-cysteine methyltransferase-like protein
VPSPRAASVSAGLSTRPGTSGGGEPTAYARSVLDVVARIPRGRVMTYGDVAEYLGSGSARTVGTAMSRYGAEVPWWRVVRADGEPHADALARLAAEGCAVTRERVQLASCRWDGREVRRRRP